MDTLTAVRAKVIEAVPEIVSVRKRRRREATSTRIRTHYIEVEESRPITLADVLRAIRKAKGLNTYDEEHVLDIWNLALPLDEQEPEVIEFIARVLGITS